MEITVNQLKDMCIVRQRQDQVVRPEKYFGLLANGWFASPSGDIAQAFIPVIDGALIMFEVGGEHIKGIVTQLDWIDGHIYLRVMSCQVDNTSKPKVYAKIRTYFVLEGHI